MKTKALILLAVFLALSALSGCAPLLSALKTKTPTPLVEVATSSPAPYPTTPTPDTSTSAGTGAEPANCAFVWDNRPLDLETNMVQAAFQAKGMNDVSARLQAYGENCIDPDTNQVVRFTTMETDFYLSFQVESLEDTETLGNRLADSLQVLRSFPEDTFPGPMPGRVFASFNGGGQIQNLSFDMQQAAKALDENLRGSALIQALSQQ